MTPNIEAEIKAYLQEYKADIEAYVCDLKPIAGSTEAWHTLRRGLFSVLHEALRANRTTCKGDIHPFLSAHLDEWKTMVHTEEQNVLGLFQRLIFLIWETVRPSMYAVSIYHLALFFVRWSGMVDDDWRVRFWQIIFDCRHLYHDNEAMIDVGFIDCPEGRYAYCKQGLPGSDILKLTHLTRALCSTVKIEAEMDAAIHADSVARFDICRTLGNKTISFGLLTYILSHNATKIVVHALKAAAREGRALPYEKLLFFACGHKAVIDGPAAALVQTVEELKPGTVKATSDPLGNNLLWYAYVYKKFPPHTGLIQTLLKCGTDPDHRNHLDLSYSMIAYEKHDA